MNPFQAFLHLLADPNIAFILFTLGFHGPAVRAAEPELRDRHHRRVRASSSRSSASAACRSTSRACCSIVLAIVLFVLELTVTSHGLLAIGGLIAFVLGASALYTERPTDAARACEVALPIIVLMTTRRRGLPARWSCWRPCAPVGMSPSTSASGREQVPRDLVGLDSEVRRALIPTGTVYAAGEEWTARSADGRSLERGTPVRDRGPGRPGR